MVPIAFYLSNTNFRVAKFEKVLEQCPVNMSDLETLSWSGVPQQFRTKVWKMLCGYLPAGKSEQVKSKNQETFLKIFLLNYNF